MDQVLKWLIDNWAGVLVVLTILGGVVKAVKTQDAAASNTANQFKAIVDKQTNIDEAVAELRKQVEATNSNMEDKIDEHLEPFQAGHNALVGTMSVTLKGVYACLEGLTQLNCNGPVTKAKEALKEHLFSLEQNYIERG